MVKCYIIGCNSGDSYMYYAPLEHHNFARLTNPTVLKELHFGLHTNAVLLAPHVVLYRYVDWPTSPIHC